jgi:hypothetical protein
MKYAIAYLLSSPKPKAAPSNIEQLRDLFRIFLINRYKEIDQKKSSGTSVEIMQLEKDTAGSVKNVMPAQKAAFLPYSLSAVKAQKKLVPACSRGELMRVAHSASPKIHVVE